MPKDQVTAACRPSFGHPLLVQHAGVGPYKNRSMRTSSTYLPASFACGTATLAGVRRVPPKPRDQPSQVLPGGRFQEPVEARRAVDRGRLEDALQDRCPPGAVLVLRHPEVLLPDAALIRRELIWLASQNGQVHVQQQRGVPRFRLPVMPG